MPRREAAGPPAPAGRTVWRLTLARYAARAFDGEGARLYGGRFNHPGTAVVYCSESLSLAALEYLVHVDPDNAPGDLVAIPAELPPGLAVVSLGIPDLPADWRAYPAPESLKDLGTDWVRAGRSAALIIPSAVVPREENVVLNPAHPDFPTIRIGVPEPFAFDPRLWRR